MKGECRDLIIGLTGAIGAGKSTVSAIFSDMGFSVIDCDAISHGLDVQPEYINAVRKEFGDGVIDISCGTARVSRKELAEIAFSSAEAKKRLEAITHPIILGVVYERINAAKAFGRDIVIDAPLLFEAGLDRACDVTVGVTASEEIRRERAIRRGGISAENIERRISLQPKSDYYVSKCDYIINNDGSENELKTKISAFISEMKKGGADDK